MQPTAKLMAPALLTAAVVVGALTITMATSSKKGAESRAFTKPTSSKTLSGVVQSRDLPPLPDPLIKSETDVKSVTVSNTRNEPVSLSAEIKVGQYSYGDGFVTISSERKILQITGEWVITMNSRQVVRQPWTFTGLYKLVAFKSLGFDPPVSIKLPVAGPSQPVAEKSQIIQRISLSVRDVVFADGSFWGRDGFTKLQNLRREASRLATLTEGVKSKCLQLAPEEIAAELSKPIPAQILVNAWDTGKLDLDMASLAFFSNLLLDRQKLLRPNYLQLLDQASQVAKDLSE